MSDIANTTPTQSRRTEILLLIRDKQTRNCRTGESTNRTREHRTNGNTGHITTTTGRDLRQDTDLVTQGADVSESTERVGGDQPRAIGEVGVCFLVLEGVVGDEFVLAIQC